ncbi:hypothetical protein AB0B10_29850 [Micromonospora arborensis]|uniref:hypothetical protein n=1 Tax=Micromonospora arborensis TaxID=2116518 RepID=UPI0033F8CFDD
MPPRRHPRSWLAGRLRSAAGAVHRLAGRVEPAGQLPASPPSAPPTPAPRRFGEPPQHWLDLVSAHAPGLLHDLDLDVSPIGSDDAPAHDDRPGETGSIGRLDAAAPATGGAFDGTTSASGPTRASGAAAAGRRGGPGTTGFAGPDGSRSPGGTGRSGRRSATGDGPANEGTAEAGSPGGGGPGTPAATSGSGASARPGTGGDTPPVGGNGLPRAGEPARQARALIRPATSGPLAAPTSHPPPRTDDFEPTRPTPRAPDPRWSRPPATTGDALADRLPGVHDGLRDDPDGPGDDQTRSREDHPGFAGGHPGFAGQPGFTVGQPGFTVGHPGFAGRRGDPGGTPPSGPGKAATRRAPAGPDLDAVDRVARWTGSAGGTAAADAEGTTVDRRRDLNHAGGDWPWPTLPDEPARPRQQPRRPAGQRVDETDTFGGAAWAGGAWAGGAWAGGWGRGPTDGGRSTSTGAPSSTAGARVTDPWPALPDDAALWTVPGDAVNDAQLSRLDREQAGG